MRLALIMLTLSLTACSGARKTARVEPLAPEAGPLVATLLTAPVGCPIYDGVDRPDYDSQGLDCLVKWIQEAQSYLAAGGKPTVHTNAANIEKNRALARKLGARIETWLTGARPGRRREAVPVPRKVAPVDEQASQQSYLSGMIYYQRGEYEKARAEWLMAVKLDPSNSDAKAGLARLDKLSTSP